MHKAIIKKNIQAYSRDEVFKEVEKELGIKGLTEQFWEAEHIISHETVNNVVFLHVIEPLAEQIVFFGFLKKPMIWNKQWIQVVVFLNINDNLRQLYEMYGYINDVIMPKWADLIDYKLNDEGDYEK